jgi:hypothetical protein
MTQPTEAVGGSNDTIVAAEPTIEDRFAARAEALFGDEEREPEEDEPQGDIHPEDAAALEAEVAEEELAEAEIDDADLPPITPPVSWTAEEKEEFASLPRALQETLGRREAEREKFVQTKAQEVKTATQKAEQDAAEQITRLQNAHVQTLQALLPEIPARPPAHLMATNPAGYASQLEMHENALAQHRYVQQVVQQVAAQQEAAERAAAQQEAKDNEAALRDQFPEYFTEQGPELERSLRSTALALGYSEDQLDHVNAQDVLAMRQASEWKAKADKFDTLMARQMEKVREAKKLPKISKPGTTQGKGVIESQRYASDRQAMRSGDMDAAARVFGRHL